MSSKRWTGRTTRRAASAVTVIAALAAAGPVAEASAQTPVLPAPAAAALSDLGLAGIPLPTAGFAWGAVATGDVLNGGTTVCVTSGSSVCSTNFAP
jgi:hypothetical protein